MTKYLHTMIRISSLEDTIAFFEVQTEDIRRRSVLVLAGKFVGAHSNTVRPSRQKFGS